MARFSHGADWWQKPAHGSQNGRTLPIITGKTWPEACEDVSYCLGCQPRQGSRWPCLIHLSLQQNLFLRAKCGQNCCTKGTGASFYQNVNPVFVVFMVGRFCNVFTGANCLILFLQRYNLISPFVSQDLLDACRLWRAGSAFRRIWNKDINTCKNSSVNIVCMIISKSIILLNIKIIPQIIKGSWRKIKSSNLPDITFN